MERRNFIQSLPVLSAALQTDGFGAVKSNSGFENQTNWLHTIIQPILNAWSEGKLVETMDRAEFPRKDRLRFAALEAIARTFYPLCLTDPKGSFLTEKLGSTFENSLKQGHPDSFNWDRGEQPLVDSAILAAGFLQNPSLFEKRCSTLIQQGLIEGWRKSLSIKPYDNNWLLFAAVVEAALQKWDKPFKPEAIPFAYKKFEDWYLGDGLYGDGPRFHMDYYNSIIIHPFLLILDEAGHDPAGAEKRMKRSIRYSTILLKMISENGSFPSLGRSICYRSGLFHHLAFMARKQYFDSSQDQQQIKIALDRVIRHSFQINESNQIGSGTVDSKTGILRPGLVGFQPQLAENYIGTPSLYLATWALLPLGLGKDHPYWLPTSAPPVEVQIDQALKD